MGKSNGICWPRARSTRETTQPKKKKSATKVEKGWELREKKNESGGKPPAQLTNLRAHKLPGKTGRGQGRGGRGGGGTKTTRGGGGGGGGDVCGR